jgi:ADP-heptose:LPS heptosyltransferase
MSLPRFLIQRIAPLLALRRAKAPERSPTDPRILVIRRGSIGDMIFALPLLHALRRHHPRAVITVACDSPGQPIAVACAAVNVVIVLRKNGGLLPATIRNAAQLQDYDWVLAAEPIFDREVASLTRLTNGAIRIGCEGDGKKASGYYTHPIALPDQRKKEHEVETLLRLMSPLGLARATAFSINFGLELPEAALQFAAEARENPPFDGSGRMILINISSAGPLKFREEDFISLGKRVLNLTDLAVGLVGAPFDQQKAHEIAICMGSKRIGAVATPGPLELAALMEKALFVITPEGDTALLAVAMRRPAVVLWSEGPLDPWRAKNERHVFVEAMPGEEVIPLDRIWNALQPMLTLKSADVDKSWEEALRPGEYDPMED